MTLNLRKAWRLVAKSGIYRTEPPASSTNGIWCTIMFLFSRNTANPHTDTWAMVIRPAINEGSRNLEICINITSLKLSGSLSPSVLRSECRLHCCALHHRVLSIGAAWKRHWKGEWKDFALCGVSFIPPLHQQKNSCVCFFFLLGCYWGRKKLKKIAHIVAHEFTF